MGVTSMSEIIKIDNKYSIQINNNGATVDLLRHNEPWIIDHPQAKVLIATAYEIEGMRNDNKELQAIVSKLKNCANCNYFPRFSTEYCKTCGEDFKQWEMRK
jgi:hypothetical protein